MTSELPRHTCTANQRFHINVDEDHFVGVSIRRWLQGMLGFLLTMNVTLLISTGGDVFGWALRDGWTNTFLLFSLWIATALYAFLVFEWYPVHAMEHEFEVVCNADKKTCRVK